MEFVAVMPHLRVNSIVFLTLLLNKHRNNSRLRIRIFGSLRLFYTVYIIYRIKKRCGHLCASLIHIRVPSRCCRV